MATQTLEMFVEEPVATQPGRLTARQLCALYGYDYAEIEARLAEFRRKRDGYVAPPTRKITWLELDWSPARAA